MCNSKIGIPWNKEMDLSIICRCQELDCHDNYIGELVRMLWERFKDTFKSTFSHTWPSHHTGQLQHSGQGATVLLEPIKGVHVCKGKHTQTLTNSLLSGLITRPLPILLLDMSDLKSRPSCIYFPWKHSI